MGLGGASVPDPPVTRSPRPGEGPVPWVPPPPWGHRRGHRWVLGMGGVVLGSPPRVPEERSPLGPPRSPQGGPGGVPTGVGGSNGDTGDIGDVEDIGDGGSTHELRCELRWGHLCVPPGEYGPVQASYNQ